ncbi:MAG TPA: hypothetical protein VMK12_21580, partial [Anaeromyxobacteraceae bacterium]|nr:hypothetical protein [Anaeromyxobacteraceae bacterium]
ACEHYQTALRLDPDSTAAHMGLAVLLLRRGEIESARRHGQLGFQGRATAWEYRGTGHPVTLLVLMSALGGNIPIDEFIGDRSFRKWTLVPEFCDPRAELPPHDLVLNAVGDADLCSSALDTAMVALSRTNAPVLNLPSRVRATGRAANAARLARLPGVITARSAELRRELLAAPDAARMLGEKGFCWPLLLRSPGFHTGQHFVKVERPDDLRCAVEGLPGSTLLAIEFIDTVSPDGKFRKYRVMMVDGELHPLHLAVSTNWKVHYFSAEMANHPEHRAEDEAFLSEMPEVLGQRVMGTLQQIGDLLGLDYGGCDFAVDDQGRVVVFEANATMIIATPAEGQFAYRARPIERVRQAVRRMLLRKAGRSVDEKIEYVAPP